MSAFKVWQRVRIVSTPSAVGSALIGQEAVIVRRGNSWEWILEVAAIESLWPREPTDLPPYHYGLNSEHLVPLTNPKESEWADAMVKRVTKPLASKVTPWVTA